MRQFAFDVDTSTYDGAMALAESLNRLSAGCIVGRGRTCGSGQTEHGH
jgi:hypothetical protein